MPKSKSSDKTNDISNLKENKNPSWPASQIYQWDIEKLIPYARNSRTHSDEQIAQIAASIKEWGWTNPVLCDETGMIIAGHGRVMAARKLGVTQIPVMIASGWTEAQKKAYVLADNQLALNAGWDMDLLKVEIGDLDDLDFDLDLIGFDEKTLNGLMADKTEGLTDPDEVPDVPDDPLSALGDVWVMGNHRLICGDATKTTDWDLLDVKDGFICFTSPPYNLGKSAKLSGNKRLKSSRNAYAEYDDSASSDDYAGLVRDSLSAALAYCDCAAFNVQPLAGSKRELMKLFDEYSSQLIDIITWDKKHAAPQMAEGVLSSRYEWIVLFSKFRDASRRIPLSSWRGKYSSVYEAPPQRNNQFASIHGATFPVHLPEFIMGDLMNRSRGVVDCFMGTGTTLIASEKLNRECRGIEISPAYVDVAVKRWQEFTGNNAILESTGQTFNEIAEHGRKKEAV